MSRNYLNGAVFWAIYATDPSKERRRLLLDMFNSDPEGLLPVNKKHQASSKDLDLAKLLKKGEIRRVRESYSPTHRQTYLTLS